ncbi:phage tail assembly protein T [Photobacterium sp. 1_MG-2023]|uniref:phage tail assembly protein T n=1 Tax=Photobacterium sp. 1_MG-2023 TaxID=3062646 RepID=UPI0026E32784|nr:phage tail assembly protein T [Photobacterium sp. 1_MG-2023]MDO6707920.1 phage tail assembly protein T [Photobacterium sp. 1_MG-2023]
MEAEREFAQHLAREYRTPCWRTLLASLSATAVIEWRDYFYRHGFSHQKADFHMAMICTQLWNASPIRTNPVKLSDFLPSLAPESPEEAPEERTDEELMALGASAGGFRIECPDS